MEIKLEKGDIVVYGVHQHALLLDDQFMLVAIKDGSINGTPFPKKVRRESQDIFPMNPRDLQHIAPGIQAVFATALLMMELPSPFPVKNNLADTVPTRE